MTIGDICTLNERRKFDLLEICKFSLETGCLIVLEETPIGAVHEAWWKFEVKGYRAIPYVDGWRVCIIAYI